MDGCLILVEGPSAGGKSSAIDRLLGRHQPLSFVDLDFLKERTFRLGSWRMWEALADAHGVAWRRELAYSVGLYWLEKLMRLGIPIIMELCDSFQLEGEVGALTRRFDYREFRCLVMPPLEECLRRNEQRMFKKGPVAFSHEKVEASYRWYEQRLQSMPGLYDLVITSSSPSVDAVAGAIADAAFAGEDASAE